MFARIYTLPVAVETPRILQAHWTAVHHTLSQFPMTPNTSVRQWVRMQHFTASKNNLKYMWLRQNWSEIIDRNTVSCQLWKVKKKTKSGYPAVTWCRGRRVQHKNVCEGMRLVAPITANLSHALTQTHAQRHTHTGFSFYDIPLPMSRWNDSTQGPSQYHSCHYGWLIIASEELTEKKRLRTLIMFQIMKTLTLGVVISLWVIWICFVDYRNLALGLNLVGYVCSCWRSIHYQVKMIQPGMSKVWPEAQSEHMVWFY